QEIGVKNIAILFTDLKGSTRLYNEKGDAFSYKVVSDHFDILIENAYKHEGAIVKTIGDAVMAIFLNPLNAIEYAINIQSSIDDLNEKLEEKFVSLKVGIHYGPALAVTMNEKLDYFGTTVNLAARTEGQCKGDDIVITKTLYNYPGVVEMLMEKKVKLEEFQTEIKGFDRSYSMVRILP
ncbi:MAG: adenylate/guanylate cyclase domain-containing protein, partial [Leptospiraceae bacterium]|nr:adenylate/guanylate cyclase domain-containing protein [Leptospiraceae bacterium]